MQIIILKKFEIFKNLGILEIFKINFVLYYTYNYELLEYFHDKISDCPVFIPIPSLRYNHFYHISNHVLLSKDDL